MKTKMIKFGGRSECMNQTVGFNIWLCNEGFYANKYRSTKNVVVCIIISFVSESHCFVKLSLEFHIYLLLKRGKNIYDIITFKYKIVIYYSCTNKIMLIRTLNETLCTRTKSIRDNSCTT